MRFALSVAILLSVGAAQAQAPGCMLGQSNSKLIDVINPLANELDKIGQVMPVTYSMTDPFIREAVNDGKIGEVAKDASLEQHFQVARSLRLPYVIWLEPTVGEADPRLKGSKKGFRTTITLYRDKKKIWTDEFGLEVSVGKTDSTLTTADALASAFAEKLSTGPFKTLIARPKNTTPDAGKGQAPIVPENRDDDPELSDFAAIMQRVNELIRLNRLNAAEMLLRDSVDAAPKDANRRRELIQFLQTYGRTQEAVAVTLASGAALGDPTLTPLAARILMESGKNKEAQTLLNDAVATNPNNAPIRILLAELRLLESQPDQALRHIEIAIKAESTAEALGTRALVRALLGGEDGVKIDLGEAVKASPSIFETHYSRWAKIWDQAMVVEGPDLRSLFQKAVLNRKADEVIDLIEDQERLAKASIAFWGENPANARYEKSHANRLLAMNLLIQAMGELRVYTQKGDEDSLNEARIDFGEMLKALSAAQLKFTKESKDAGYLGADRIFDHSFSDWLSFGQGLLS